jgi:hypothetical protein
MYAFAAPRDKPMAHALPGFRIMAQHELAAERLQGQREAETA